MQSKFNLNHVFNKLSLFLCGVMLGCNFFVSLCAAPKKTRLVDAKAVVLAKCLVRNCFRVRLAETGCELRCVKNRDDQYFDLLDSYTTFLCNRCDEDVKVIRFFQSGFEALLGDFACSRQMRVRLECFIKKINKFTCPTQVLIRKGIVLADFIETVMIFKAEANELAVALRSDFMVNAQIGSRSYSELLATLNLLIKKSTIGVEDAELQGLMDKPVNLLEPHVIITDPLEGVELRYSLKAHEGEPEAVPVVIFQRDPVFAQRLELLLTIARRLLEREEVVQILEQFARFVPLVLELKECEQRRAKMDYERLSVSIEHIFESSNPYSQQLVNSMYMCIATQWVDRYLQGCKDLLLVLRNRESAFWGFTAFKKEALELSWTFEFLSIICVHLQVFEPRLGSGSRGLGLNDLVAQFLLCYQDYLTSLKAYSNSKICLAIHCLRSSNILLKNNLFQIMSARHLISCLDMTGHQLDLRLANSANVIKREINNLLPQAEVEKECEFKAVLKELEAYHLRQLTNIQRTQSLGRQLVKANAERYAERLFNECLKAQNDIYQKMLEEEQQRFNALLSQHRDYCRRLTFVAALQEADDLEEEIEPCVSEKTYRSVFHLSAQNDLQEADLGEDLERQIRAKLESVPEMGSNLVLSGFGSLYRRLRVGNYRVIYRINGKIVHVIACYRRAVAYGQDLYNRLGSFESDLRLVEQ